MGSSAHSEASFSGIAVDALEAARAAQSKADQVERDGISHEKLCAERYGAINKEIGSIKAIIVWAGTAGFGIVMALLAFLAKAQWDSIAELRSASLSRAELRQQITQMPPRVIIQPAPGQPTTGATIERESQPQ